MIYLLSLLISITHIWNSEHNIFSVLVWYTIFTPALCAFSAFERKEDYKLFAYPFGLAALHYGISHVFYNLEYNFWLVVVLAVLVTFYCKGERAK